MDASKIMLDFWNVLLVETRLTLFVRVPPMIFWYFWRTLFFSRWNVIIWWGKKKKHTALFHSLINGKSQVFSACSYVYLHSYTQICDKGGPMCPPLAGLNRVDKKGYKTFPSPKIFFLRIIVYFRQVYTLEPSALFCSSCDASIVQFFAISIFCTNTQCTLFCAVGFSDFRESSSKKYRMQRK